MAVVERGQEGADEALLRRALRWANRGAGRASPNPLVGAVVVKSGAIVGEGYHKGPGTAHAEVVALGAAGRRARGATLYCNLEPCCHYGKTPPCTDAILNAGVARVVASIVDPSPLVNGRGLEILRQAGLEVSLGGLAEEAAHLNRAYLHWRRSGRPLVTLKLAASLDGKIATAGGESRWITRGAARAYVHRLRRQVDAVVVGSGTALKDDPLLDFIRGQLEQFAAVRRKVCFEITETSAVQNIAQARSLMLELGTLGCRFALDDFGSGMASYGYLRDLPVHFVKIDRCFVRQLATSPLDRAIVGSIHHIGHMLGIQTVAEGVETREVEAQLELLGVDFVQGYLYGRPRPLAELCASGIESPAADTPRSGHG